MMGEKPQQCFIMPLLPGTDGIQKMSKSLGNYIGISEPANDIYGKTMSLPDSMIIEYLESVTDIPDGELSDARVALKDNSGDPMELKKRLARELVQQFHSKSEAVRAQDYFERTVQRRELPQETEGYKVYSITEASRKKLTKILVETGLATSTSDARRIIAQGAIELNGNKLASEVINLELNSGDVMRVGRRGFLKIVRDS
jgi:tyrosyl-tRNA synthetase